MRSNLFAPENQEQESTQPGLRLQNGKMLKVELNGEIMARRGSMVAYQGQVRFEALGAGGIGKWLKSKVTGEGVPIMKMSGQGDVFLANEASDIYLIDLEGMHLRAPEMVFDLPAGGRRLIQRADGYVATMVAGQTTMEHGEATGVRPGGLVRF